MIQNIFTPNYQLIVNPKLKYIHLTIDHQGELIVKSPHNNQNEITQLLSKKRDWINRAQKKFSEKKGKFPLFDNKNEEVYYLGIPYPIRFLEASKNNKISFDYLPQQEFQIAYKEKNKTLFHKCIDDFYKNQAKELLIPMVEQQAKIMKLTPTAINVRKTKRQWGSCSAKNHLSFNSHIVKLPLDVIQYIIIHELAHIRHKHHQKAFWKEVEHYCPNYKKCEQQLKEYLT
ncbi:M48 family metallopeptidase [bacterium]|nr:M48 family metallopeptidase [bacterium]MBU1958123.1 M48 family metallopeptidase [bacterium]